MTPHYADDWLTIYSGDVREVLPTLASESVDCIVTSPPYWGLRDYGNDGQIGLEREPEEYVANLVGIFRELRRVLKASGTCWLNLGDSYSGYHGNGKVPDVMAPSNKPGYVENMRESTVGIAGLKLKDLVGIPWRVAFALQADGWYLRSDIIWSKPNPMPESVTDRPTKAHEYLFLLTKSARYYFDADAVREDGAGRLDRGKAVRGRFGEQGWTQESLNESAGRNLRSVWTIATRPYPGAHFAVFPPELPERCIKAGSSERGVCPECGTPWERQTVKTTHFEGGSGKAGRTADDANANGKWAGIQYGTNIKLGPVVDVETTGWRPDCAHDYLLNVIGGGEEVRLPLPPVPAVVLDPFAGSGTTGMVANRLSRRAILIDLNGDYLKQQLQRNAQTPLGLGVA